MDGGLDENGKLLLKKICDDFNAKIDFIKPDLDQFNGLKLGNNVTPIVYAKLLFPTLIKGIDKIIVMDSDIIVEGDIKELFSYHLYGKIIGAIPDGYIELKEMCKKKLGIAPGKEFFNSGVMLVDCNKWKKYEVLKKVIKFIKENPEKITAHDQDGLNAILVDKWQQLPYEWNMIHLFFFNSRDLKKKFGSKKLRELISNPKLIHYTTKPWIYEKVHPLADRYWYYLKQTPWKGESYQNKTFKTFLLRNFRLLIRPIPWEIKIRIKDLSRSFFGRKEKKTFHFIE
jgi:lipopolysaccharide biosynthesis glycosyltransferase